MYIKHAVHHQLVSFLILESENGIVTNQGDIIIVYVSNEVVNKVTLIRNSSSKIEIAFLKPQTETFKP